MICLGITEAVLDTAQPNWRKLSDGELCALVGELLGLPAKFLALWDGVLALNVSWNAYLLEEANKFKNSQSLQLNSLPDCWFTNELKKKVEMLKVVDA